jgi:hypothetical protein
VTSTDEQLFNETARKLEQRQRELGINPNPAGPPALPLRRVVPPALPPPQPALRAVPSDDEVSAREAAELARVRRAALTPAALASWLGRSGVGLRLREETIITELVPEPLRSWASDFPASLRGASALLSGPPGGGKTLSVVWLLAQVYKRGAAAYYESQFQWCAQGVAFVSAADLFAACFDRESREQLVVWARIPVLAIDDWGAPFEHAWSLALLDQLIDRRWSAMLPTLVTTNLAPEPSPNPRSKIKPEDTFEHRYPRIYSRLLDSRGPGLVSIFREDMRRERPSGSR